MIGDKSVNFKRIELTHQKSYFDRFLAEATHLIWALIEILENEEKHLGLSTIIPL
jgi:hypothetical protein